MKKVIAMAVAASLLIGCLSGCGASSDNNMKAQTKETVNTTLEGEGDQPVLHVLVCTHSWTKDLTDIPMFEQAAKEAGVTIEWEQIRSGWDEKKNVLLASGDVPDIFISAINDNDIASFPDLFLPMNDLIDQYAPNIQKMFQELPDTRSLATSLDGNIYGLVSVIPHRPSSYNIFSINQTWLDTLGLETPTTFDEFYEVLKAFKTKDPNQNGKDDEIPFDWAPDRGLFTAMSLIGAYGNYAEDFSGEWFSAKDGKVVFLPTTEDYKNLVSYLHKLYAEGLINQEVFTQDYSQFQARSKDTENATVGATMGWSIEDRFGTQWKDQYKVLLPIAAQDGIKPVWPANEIRTKYLTNKAQITTKCENPEAAMKWLDAFYAEEMSAQGYYGSLDLCVEKKDNQYIVLDPQDNMGADEWKWTNALVDNGIMYVSKDLESRIIAPASITERVEQDALYASYFPDNDGILPVLKFSSDENSDLAIMKADIFNVVDLYWSTWIAKGGVEEQWEAYLQELNNLNLEQMMKIYQDRYTEYLNNAM